MDKRIRAIAVALGLTFGGLCLTAPAGAAPAGLGPGAVKDAASDATAVQQVVWISRCWRDRWGVRHCRRVWRPGVVYGAPYVRPRVGVYVGGPRRYYRGGGVYYGSRAYRGGSRAFRAEGFRGGGVRAYGGRVGRRR